MDFDFVGAATAVATGQGFDDDDNMHDTSEVTELLSKIEMTRDMLDEIKIEVCGVTGAEADGDTLERVREIARTKEAYQQMVFHRMITHHLQQSGMKLKDMNVDSPDMKNASESATSFFTQSHNSFFYRRSGSGEDAAKARSSGSSNEKDARFSSKNLDSNGIGNNKFLMDGGSSSSSTTNVMITRNSKSLFKSDSYDAIPGLSSSGTDSAKNTSAPVFREFGGKLSPIPDSSPCNFPNQGPEVEASHNIFSPEISPGARNSIVSRVAGSAYANNNNIETENEEKLTVGHTSFKGGRNNGISFQIEKSPSISVSPAVSKKNVEEKDHMRKFESVSTKVPSIVDGDLSSSDNERETWVSSQKELDKLFANNDSDDDGVSATTADRGSSNRTITSIGVSSIGSDDKISKTSTAASPLDANKLSPPMSPVSPNSLSPSSAASRKNKKAKKKRTASQGLSSIGLSSVNCDSDSVCSSVFQFSDEDADSGGESFQQRRGTLHESALHRAIKKMTTSQCLVAPSPFDDNSRNTSKRSSKNNSNMNSPVFANALREESGFSPSVFPANTPSAAAKAEGVEAPRRSLTEECGISNSTSTQIGKANKSGGLIPHSTSDPQTLIKDNSPKTSSFLNLNKAFSNLLFLSESKLFSSSTDLNGLNVDSNNGSKVMKSAPEMFELSPKTKPSKMKTLSQLKTKLSLRVASKAATSFTSMLKSGTKVVPSLKKATNSVTNNRMLTRRGSSSLEDKLKSGEVASNSNVSGMQGASLSSLNRDVEEAVLWDTLGDIEVEFPWLLELALFVVGAGTPDKSREIRDPSYSYFWHRFFKYGCLFSSAWWMIFQIIFTYYGAERCDDDEQFPPITLLGTNYVLPPTAARFFRTVALCLNFTGLSFLVTFDTFFDRDYILICLKYAKWTESPNLKRVENWCFRYLLPLLIPWKIVAWVNFYKYSFSEVSMNPIPDVIEISKYTAYASWAIWGTFGILCFTYYGTVVMVHLYFVGFFCIGIDDMAVSILTRREVAEQKKKEAKQIVQLRDREQKRERDREELRTGTSSKNSSNTQKSSKRFSSNTARDQAFGTSMGIGFSNSKSRALRRDPSSFGASNNLKMEKFRRPGLTKRLSSCGNLGGRSSTNNDLDVLPKSVSVGGTLGRQDTGVSSASSMFESKKSSLVGIGSSSNNNLGTSSNNVMVPTDKELWEALLHKINVFKYIMRNVCESNSLPYTIGEMCTFFQVAAFALLAMGLDEDHGPPKRLINKIMVFVGLQDGPKEPPPSEEDPSGYFACVTYFAIHEFVFAYAVLVTGAIVSSKCETLLSQLQTLEPVQFRVMQLRNLMTNPTWGWRIYKVCLTPELILQNTLVAASLILFTLPEFFKSRSEGRG